ncbi:Phosphoenolpyruvate carboxykinase [Chitinophaga terrae (ex Kim and Jung 2007)]|uniref:Phosphoenolpyruvate carboxykinase n=1 Tax=Chitinophaga terrae (ex Kim and Jung 2007) TaxID=408074 RepID=A0A1H4BMA9_9BACT|nr:phosphoenolpyruvate carboxykinase (ATP) [Chitinophaga terrae (ex Kim and Jung 2007)]MDQ0110457.1 phosphoenolpyruvate carboxykinase (ATP) [Chitinophaga terrae (ex Kim and Jung 2007)]SEA49269.1 Phosphoenolpyruvate carboxykinase [Chitinophaga terrae (ex Kim and Jung 2007)]
MKAPKQFSNGVVVLRADQISWNLSVSDLISQTILTNQGTLSETGALMCDTGKFTVRSPNDKYIVSDDVTEQTIWWGEVNQRISKASFSRIFKKMSGYLSRKKLFANEVYACASPKYKFGLHIITEFPWQSLFVRNLFISPTTSEMENFRADWTIICIPGFEADPAVDGTNSPNFTIINFGEKIILIGGSAYTGEIKKGVFTVLNYLLPKDNDVFPMHCSANIGEKGDTAFFLVYQVREKQPCR